MEGTGQTSKEYFNVLTIIHAALTYGQVFFGLVFFYLNTNLLSPNNGDIYDIFIFVVPATVVMGFVASTFLMKARLGAIKKMSGLKEKLRNYRTAFIIRMALLESPSFFALVAYYLTGNYFFLGLSGIIIIVFVIERPTRSKVAMDLELNMGDKALLDNPEAIVA